MLSAAAAVSHKSSIILTETGQSWLPKIAIALYTISLMKFVSRNALSGTAGVQGVVELGLPGLALVLLAGYCFSNYTPRRLSGCAKLLIIFGAITIIGAQHSLWAEFSLAKSCVYLTVLAISVLAVDAMGAEGCFRSLYYSLVLVLVAGLVVTATSGSYTLLYDDEYSGRRRVSVLEIHPSMVADLAALGFLMFRLFPSRIHWTVQLGLLLLNVATGTKTSTAVLGFIIICHVIGKLFRSKARELIVAGGLSILVASIMIALLVNFPIETKILDVMEPIYGTHIQEEAGTLNGRVELWGVATELMTRQIVIGYGFDGVRQELLARVPWAGHAHNGFVEMTLAGGLCGLSFVVAAWAYSIFAAFRAAPEFKWPLLSIHAYLLGVTLTGPTPVNLQFIAVIMIVWCEAFAAERVFLRLPLLNRRAAAA